MREFVAVRVWLGVRLHCTYWTIWKTRLLIKLNKQNGFISAYSGVFCIIYGLCVHMHVCVRVRFPCVLPRVIMMQITYLLVFIYMSNFIIIGTVAIMIDGGQCCWI